MASGESTYKEALGAMIVSAKTRRMLLQLRSRNKIWGFFGGKKKANETNKEALTREIMAVSYTHLTLPTIYSV